MRDNKKDLYNKVLKQVPVRNEKIKQEVMKTYDNKSHIKSGALGFVSSVAIVMAVVFLVVFISPNRETLVLKVYAAQGQYVELGKEAVSLKSKYEPYVMTYSTINKKQKEDYSCVFYFDINCESEEVERITYKIQGENTASNIADFNKNNVWFAKITDKELNANETNTPFDYRYMETEETKEVFTYLGNEIVVEDLVLDNNYYIEYKIKKDGNGQLHAESFEVKVIIEKQDGTTIERELVFEPMIKTMEDDVSGTNLMNELWVSVK